MIDINSYIKNSRLEIIVRPNSSSNEIIGYDQARSAVRVNIKAPAEDNKANIEVIKFFSKFIGKKIRIITGLKNKRKTLSIE